MITVSRVQAVVIDDGSGGIWEVSTHGLDERVHRMVADMSSS